MASRLIRPLVALTLLSLGAACSTPPGGPSQGGWVDAALQSNIADRGSTMVSNALPGWYP